LNDNDISIWDCPKCSDGKLIKRQNNRTKEYFLGCTNYPKCPYTQKLEPEETDGIPDAASVWE
jgi:ssDNA-binding Zn-finger/Zn-ribbon topoisomerase 1